MPKKLTKAEQLKILHALPAENKKMIKKHFKHHLQAGGGFMDTVKSFLSKAGSVIGPIAKEIGPIALKEFIVPMIKDKLKGGAIMTAGRGGALKLSGQGEGGALRLAGQHHGSMLSSSKPRTVLKKRMK